MKNNYWFLVIPELEDELKKYCTIFCNDTHVEFLRYLYVIHTILYNKRIFQEKYEKDGVAINRDKLAEEKLRIKNSSGSLILKNLVKWQFIDLVEQYKEGRSRRYRINSRWEANTFHFKAFCGNDAYFIKQLIVGRNQALNASKFVAKQYKMLSEDIRINSDGLEYLNKKYTNSFMNELTEQYKYHGPVTGVGYSTIISKIRIEYSDLGLVSFLIGEFFVERPDEKSRLYTNLCSLKREFRLFLHLNGRPLQMTDLVNSQIVFSIPVIENHLKMKSGAIALTRIPDLEVYRRSALNGDFYETLAETASIKLVDAIRSEFKKSFYKEVYFSRIKSKGGPIKRAFKKKFPTVSKAINEIKKTNHSDFAIRLQRLEASILIDKVLKQLCNENITALSIHDAIVVSSEKDVVHAEQLICSNMEDMYGLRPKFKRN